MEEIKRDNNNVNNTNNAPQPQQGLTFRDILFIIRKHWIVVVALLVLCTAGGFIWSKVERPTYKSTGTMLVSYDSGSASLTQDYSFSNYITNTYVAFIKEDAVLEKSVQKIKDKADKDEITAAISLSGLKSNLTVSANSLILSVSYVAKDPEDAKAIVQIVIETASEVADEGLVDEQGNPVLDDKGNQKPKYRFLNGNLTVVSNAKDGIKVSHILKYTAIGLGAGVVLAFIYMVIRELSDNTFKSAEEIERLLNIPVLAGIPDYHFDDEKKGGK